VLGPALADPLRRNGDEGGKDASKCGAENDEPQDRHDAFGLPPDKTAGNDGGEQAGPDHCLCRDRPGGKGKPDPDGGGHYVKRGKDEVGGPPGADDDRAGESRQ